MNRKGRFTIQKVVKNWWGWENMITVWEFCKIMVGWCLGWDVWGVIIGEKKKKNCPCMHILEIIICLFLDGGEIAIHLLAAPTVRV